MIFGPVLFGNIRIVGQQVFSSVDGEDTKVFFWTVPGGVFNISAVAVGAGGNESDRLPDSRGPSSGGGALSYSNNISVTPGETLEIRIQAGGSAGEQSPARYSGILRDSTWLLRAQVGGSARAHYNDESNDYPGLGGQATNGIGAVRQSGGNGTLSEGIAGSGGGGAAGYSGKGGDGGNVDDRVIPELTAAGQSGSGGGGGGGGSAEVTRAVEGGAGGGVGLNGQGSNGAGGSGSTATRRGRGGGGGSGGSSGSNGVNMGNMSGGTYGGGGVSAYTSTIKGGPGGVRIIWGQDRSYPFNAGDL